MSGFSTYLSQSIINKTLVTPTVPTAATLYLALFTANPTDDNVTANEVVPGGGTGVWYGRMATGSWAVPVGVGIVTSNSNQITFNAVTGSAVTISHWGIYDAATGGNLLYSDSVGASKTFAVGDVPVIAAGALTITVD